MGAIDPLARRQWPAAPPAATADLRLLFDAMAMVEAVQPYTFARHQHLTYEIIVVDHGRYRCTLNGVELWLRRNHVLFVKPGDWHEDILAPPVRYFGMQLRLDGVPLLPRTAPFRADAEPHQQVVDAPRAVLALVLDDACAAAAQQDAFSPHLQQALQAECFWRLISMVPPEAIDPRFHHRTPEDRFANDVHQLFLAHENARLGVPRMAERLGMSQSALTARCRARLGRSPADAFRAFKMERALALLRGTEMSVGEVSDHLGFQNPYHFSRLFRRAFGRPPSRA